MGERSSLPAPERSRQPRSPSGVISPLPAPAMPTGMLPPRLRLVHLPGQLLITPPAAVVSSVGLSLADQALALLLPAQAAHRFTSATPATPWMGRLPSMAVNSWSTTIALLVPPLPSPSTAGA